MSTLIRLRNVSKSYAMPNYRVEALKDISIEIERGEFVSIVGPSGSGKSVLLKVCSGIERVSSGSIEVNGVNITTLSDDQLAKWRKSNVGIVLKTPQLIQNLNILENVMILMDRDHKTRKQQLERALQWLRFVGLENVCDHFPSELDAEKQRLAVVARSLVNDPLLIMGDEPEGNLDSHGSEAVMQLLRKVNQQGTAVLFVTHNTHFVLEASRIIPMIDGQVVTKSQARGEQEVVPGNSH